MSNTALVSFKLAPDRYAVLKALADGQGKSMGEMVCETVEYALDLDRQARLMREFLMRSASRPASRAVMQARRRVFSASRATLVSRRAWRSDCLTALRAEARAEMRPASPPRAVRRASRLSMSSWLGWPWREGRTAPAAGPSARWWHATASLGGDQVLLFGGWDDIYDGETWVATEFFIPFRVYLPLVVRNH